MAPELVPGHTSGQASTCNWRWFCLESQADLKALHAIRTGGIAHSSITMALYLHSCYSHAHFTLIERLR